MGEHGNIIDKSDDWYTPAHVFEALGARFDLDVAAPVEGPRYAPTSRWFCSEGLERAWAGFVWMTPRSGTSAPSKLGCPSSSRTATASPSCPTGPRPRGGSGRRHRWI
jgi:hypothetical protein